MRSSVSGDYGLTTTGRIAADLPGPVDDVDLVAVYYRDDEFVGRAIERHEFLRSDEPSPFSRQLGAAARAGADRGLWSVRHHPGLASIDRVRTSFVTELRLTHADLVFCVDVTVHERDRRYMASADLGEHSQDVGVRDTLQEAVRAALRSPDEPYASGMAAVSTPDD